MKRVRKLLLVVTAVLVVSLFMGKVNASGITAAYKITASKDVSDKIATPAEDVTADYCPTALAIDGVTNCEKLTLSKSKLVETISTETVLNTIYYISTYEEGFDIGNLTVPKDIIVIATGLYLRSTTSNVVLNGIIKTGSIFSACNISGTGNLILDYGVDLGDIPDEEKSFADVYRFALQTISDNIKVKIIGTEIKDGLVFGFIDTLTNGTSDLGFTEADRQARLKQLNNILDESISKNYEVVMQSSTFKEGTDETTYYYGVLKSKAKPVATTTKKVTNPKTGDAIMMITSLIGLISVGSFITLKKIRKAN